MISNCQHLVKTDCVYLLIPYIIVIERKEKAVKALV